MSVTLPKPGCDPMTRQKILDDIDKIDDYQVSFVLKSALIVIVQLKRRLKNRMSAQAARERKKARMDELERQLGIMSERFRRLEVENYRLKERLCQYEPVEAFGGSSSEHYYNAAATATQQQQQFNGSATAAALDQFNKFECTQITQLSIQSYTN